MVRTNGEANMSANDRRVGSWLLGGEGLSFCGLDSSLPQQLYFDSNYGSGIVG